MPTRMGHFVTAAAVAALVLSGSAASALPSAPGAPPRQPVRSAFAIHQAGDGRVSLRPITGFPADDGATALATAVTTSQEAFATLDPAGFAAYSTGTVFHTDPELSGEEVGAEIDMATSDAAYASRALPGFGDELGRPVVAGLAAGSSLARGHALEVNPPDAIGGADLGLSGPAESKAPPSGTPVVKQTQVDLSPALKADSFRAEAAARAVSTGCVIDSDLARGAGSANDTDLVDADPDDNSTEPLLSVSADEPPRAASQSVSSTRLVPIKGQPGRFGAVAETRQTIAPITFGLPDTDAEFTIEIGGEWVMRATADGSKGDLSFGPEGGSDDRPVLRLIQGKDVIDEVGLREIGGRTGIYVDGEPVGDIRIGGDPRAIGGKPTSKPLESPTRVAAAADVAVVRLFEPRAQLRVGHMEVGLAVPPGGVECPGISLTKTSDPELVQPGGTFSWTLAVSNPNDCVLEKVKVTDTPSVTPKVEWKPASTIPKSTRGRDGALVFDGIGPILTGETKTVKINAEVDPGSAPGIITNKAVATGTCGSAPVAGTAETTTAIAPPPVAPPAPSVAQGAAPSESPARPAAGSAFAEPATSAASVSAAPKRRTQAQEADGAGLHPRTGGPAGPFLALAVGLVGTGRLLRRLKPRR